MNPQELAQALRAGRTVFGTCIVSPSPKWPRALEGSGLDFVFLDTEHVALDRAQLSWMCQTYSRMGLPPVVRIPSPDPFAACMVLDGGAGGVIAPYIESVAQVQALRGAVKFRPVKGERLSQRLSGGPFEPALENYLRERNTQPLIINIESTPAMRALDEILAVPDLDAVLIGPHDLSCSLGMPEEYDRPEFLAACETIFRKARAAGIGAGIHFSGSVEQLARFHELGANLLIHSSDITIFGTHLRLEIAEVKRMRGIQSSSAAKAEQVNI
ncbi:MAG TPA: aldolase/citrate lyase family protein [Verrucomicrobiae bacterium]|jgi:4-hydroxy-2-oxoheptanedioate aldolase